MAMADKKQRITILGSTGSVGINTLDVIAAHPGLFEVFALSAATQIDLMLAQCARFKPRYAVMVSQPHAQVLAEKIKTNGLETIVLWDQSDLEMIASHDDVDAVWYFGTREGVKTVELASAGNMKRTWADFEARAWAIASEGEGRDFLREATQVKNIWIPYGE